MSIIKGLRTGDYVDTGYKQKNFIFCLCGRYKFYLVSTPLSSRLYSSGYPWNRLGTVESDVQGIMTVKNRIWY